MTTRHNLCANPAAGVDLTGWTSSTCSPTRVTGLTGVPRTTGVRSTAGGYFRTPAAPCLPGQQFTVSFYIQNNSGLFQFAHTTYISYSTDAHGEQFPETFNTPNVADGATVRASFTTTIASVPADANALFLVVDSMPSGITITGVLLEPVSSLGSYFDGSFANSSWDGGVADLSRSTYRVLVGDTIFGSSVPSTVDNNDATLYTIGTRFQVSSNTTSLAVHWRASTTRINPVVVNWQLWNVDTSSLVTSGSFPYIAWDAWNEVAFSHALTAGVTYAISIVTDRYCATTHYFDSAVTHGIITGPIGAGRFHAQPNETPVLPADAFNNGGYFVDIEVGAGTPPTGPTLSVWNGSTEVGATISVWTGSAEVPAVLDSVV